MAGVAHVTLSGTYSPETCRNHLMEAPRDGILWDYWYAHDVNRCDGLPFLGGGMMERKISFRSAGLGLILLTLGAAPALGGGPGRASLLASRKVHAP